MATNTHKFLGRSAPAATVQTTLYTAPALTKCMLTSLLICNTSAGDDSVRVWIVPNGDSAAVGNAIIFDMVVDFGDPYILNGVPILEAGDFIVVFSANGNVTFTASGLEIV